MSHQRESAGEQRRDSREETNAFAGPDPERSCGQNALEIPLKDARNALSRLADAAHGGDCITLTKHGRPWAQLMPVAAAPSERRCAARWAIAGVDLDPYLLIAPQHRLAVLHQIARQTAEHPWGTDPPGLGTELRGRRLLLDSHVLQWWWCCPGLLSPLVRSLLLDPAMPLWVSAMSLLELSALARTSANTAPGGAGPGAARSRRRGPATAERAAPAPTASLPQLSGKP